MVETNCFRDFAKYASLNVMGMIGLSCYILADTFFISKGLGADGLTALNLAIPVYNFINGCGLMIGMGGGTKYSIQKSMNDWEAANRTFANAFFLTICSAVFFVLAGILFPGKIAAAFGAEGNVFEMSRTYLQVILLFSPAFLLNNLLLCFIRNDGAPQLSMTAMITGSLSNIILDWVFIFPCQMGIFGAVFATGLAPIISMAILSSHFLRGRNQFRLALSCPQKAIASGILASGAPSLVTEMSSGIVIIIFNAIILGLEGNIGVAAYGVVANLSLVVIAVYTGIAQGIQPLISAGYGVKNMSRVQAVFRYALITMAVLSAAIYAGILLGADSITRVFNSEGNPALQEIAAEGLCLYFTACPFAGFNIILAMYFTACDHPLPAHVISILRGFILIIPMAFLLARIWGILGVWCAFGAAEMAVAVFGLCLLLFWRSKQQKLSS